MFAYASFKAKTIEGRGRDKCFRVSKRFIKELLMNEDFTLPAGKKKVRRKKIHSHSLAYLGWLGDCRRTAQPSTDAAQGAPAAKKQGADPQTIEDERNVGSSGRFRRIGLMSGLPWRSSPLKTHRLWNA